MLPSAVATPDQRFAAVTQEEKEAKDFFFQCLTKGVQTPCDSGQGSDMDIELPPWYDATQYERGRQLIANHRVSFLSVVYFGFLLISMDPKSRNIIFPTAAAQKPEANRRRLVGKAVHSVIWVEDKLFPDSRSWKSLKFVRKMHLYVSNGSMRKNLGHISQLELTMSITAFVMYPLIRPHLLGLNFFNRSDGEAFVHFWAVIGSILGVQDRFNPGLHRLEVVTLICRLHLRYLFIPCGQFDSSGHTSLLESIMEFLPWSSKNAVMLLERRLLGIPGYQYLVDLAKETLCRAVFTQQELDEVISVLANTDGYSEKIDFYRMILRERMYVYEVKVRDLSASQRKESSSDNYPLSMELRSILELKPDEYLTMQEVDEGNGWSKLMSDAMIMQQSIWTRALIAFITWVCKIYQLTLVHFLVEYLTSSVIQKVKNIYAKKFE